MDFNSMLPLASEITIARLWMDSTSTMLWNFEEGMGEVDSLGTSSAGSETDTTFALWGTAVTKPAAQMEGHQSLLAGNTMLGGCELSTCLMDGSNNNDMEHQRSNLGASFTTNDGANYMVENMGRSSIGKVAQTSNLPLYRGDQVEVTCPICVKPFDQPKVLACFHSFCKSCLERQLHDRRHIRQPSHADSTDEGVVISEHCRSESNGSLGESLQASNTILVCPLCNVETQLSPQLGIDGLLSDYGLMNAVNEATRRRGAKKSNDRSMLIFGSPSSTSSSSPPLDERVVPCTGCKGGELANAYCNDCTRYLCINCNMAHRNMVCFESHHVEELSVGGVLGAFSVNAGAQLVSGGVAVSSGSSSGIGSGGGGESSSGTSPPSQSASTRSATAAAAAAAAAIAAVAASQGNLDGDSMIADGVELKNDASTHCKCLEHRSQSLLFFCLTCNLAICRDCTLTEHVAPLHAVETIDNVAEKQIGQMEALIHAAHNKQSELHEIFRLIDGDQTRLNTSFKRAQNNIDESTNCLSALIQDAQRTLTKELENAYGYKQLQLINIEREVQKMVKKMSQTMEFTQRLLKYSSPTEVMVFKPLLDARIQGFLNFNADTSSLTSSMCKIETNPVNIVQARQTIFSLMSSIQSTAVAAAATASAAATAAAVAAAASATGDGTVWPDSMSLQQQERQRNVHLDMRHSAQQMQNQKQQNRIDSTSPSSLIFYQQQAQSYHNSSNHTSRPLFAVGGRQANQQQFHRSSPPMVGSLGGGNMNRLANSLFDSFASDSNLVGRRDNLDRGIANDMLNGGISSANNDNTNALNAAWFGLGGNSSPFTIGASAPGVESAAAANFMSQHLDSALGYPTSNSVSASVGATSNMQSIFNQYEKWSSGLDPSSLGALSLSDPDTITDLSILANAQLGGLGADKMASTLGGGSASAPNNSSTTATNAFQLYPPRSQIKRQKMTYHCKFGEFGVMEGQFTEPSGVTVNAQNDIIVADTNNHRIQVFDKEGRFKFQFGECGKRDGQLLYPNRVSVNRVTGDFIVTERSPTHQIQIYNQYGHFVRKFGANILQHPRGVCVDSQGRIIVVECKVMRVIIFDAFGNVIHKFSCSRYLEFPNGVCTNDKNEILISDNRAHCIKVFNYEGHYVRQIGGEGITNYPIGVGINSQGEVIVADNHNNFNLTVFSQDGTMLNALESKVKHAQCFDVALVEDGSVVLASKDYRLYLYRYQNQPSTSL